MGKAPYSKSKQTVNGDAKSCGKISVPLGDSKREGLNSAQKALFSLYFKVKPGSVFHETGQISSKTADYGAGDAGKGRCPSFYLQNELIQIQSGRTRIDVMV
jgi:hypothetical protein